MLVLRTTQQCISNTSIRSLKNKRFNSHAVIFSGIQPTGIPHLGNYLGAIKNWVDLQYTSSLDDVLIYSIMGWDALTLHQNSEQLRNAKLETAASVLAFGIDPKRSILFHQDQVPEHLSLARILTCFTPMGKLKPMVAWRAKKLAAIRNANPEFEVDDSMLSLGSLSYPILQAANILAYRPTHIPVGEDQFEHLELCRELAKVFNRRYYKKDRKPFFTIPQGILTTCPRILSFHDPTQKMSKSSPDANSRVSLTDSPDMIRKIVRTAVTDSIPGITYDPSTRPGISNLLTILASFRSLSSTKELSSLASEYPGKGTSDLKDDVADAIIEGWRKPREEFKRLWEDQGYLVAVLRDGQRRAQSISRTTVTQVRNIVGLK